MIVSYEVKLSIKRFDRFINFIMDAGFRLKFLFLIRLLHINFFVKVLLEVFG